MKDRWRPAQCQRAQDGTSRTSTSTCIHNLTSRSSPYARYQHARYQRRGKKQRIRVPSPIPRAVLGAGIASHSVALTELNRSFKGGSMMNVRIKTHAVSVAIAGAILMLAISQAEARHRCGGRDNSCSSCSGCSSGTASGGGGCGCNDAASPAGTSTDNGSSVPPAPGASSSYQDQNSQSAEHASAGSANLKGTSPNQTSYVTRRRLFRG